MHILLIDPPYKGLKGVGAECAYTAGTVALAAYLRAAGIDVAVLTGDLLEEVQSGSLLDLDMKAYAEGQDAYIRAVEDDQHPVWQRIAGVLRKEHPKAVGISYLTPTRYSVERVARVVKSVDPNILVVVGGHHPTFCPDDVLTNSDIDIAVRGEGEVPLLAIAQSILDDSLDWDKIPGVSFRTSAGEVVHTAPPAIIAELDSLPFPARDLVLDCDYKNYPVHYMLTARGCPYTCSFCSDRRLWQGKVRRRSLDNVFEEIRELARRYPFQFIDFVDGTFTFDPKYLRGFCERMMSEHSGLRWRCTARYDTLDDELLSLMRDAGCAALYFGLESGSARVLESVNKRLTLDDVVRTSAQIRKHGIVSIVSVLLGLPNETESDIRETLDMMKALDADVYDVNCYVPLPGTPLFDAMSEEEKAAIDWRRLAYKSLGDRSTRDIGSDRLNSLVLEAYGIAEDARKVLHARIASAKAAAPKSGERE
jgi:anaerobic magnesium-protoporphyrin IX monomethyl ester cyclase